MEKEGRLHQREKRVKEELKFLHFQNRGRIYTLSTGKPAGGGGEKGA